MAGLSTVKAVQATRALKAGGSIPQLNGPGISTIGNDFYISSEKSCTDVEKLLFEQRLKVIENEILAEEEKKEMINLLNSDIQNIRSERQQIHNSYNKKEDENHISNKILVCGFVCATLLFGIGYLVGAGKNKK